MANKIKMKCAICHKAFKSSKATQLLCDDCERKRRQEKAVPATTVKTIATNVTPPGTKPVWLETAIVRDGIDPMPSPPPAPQRQGPPVDRPQRPTGPVARAEVKTPHGAIPAKRAPRADSAKHPRVPREPKPVVPIFEPTAEQIAAIEARYLELAQPEFDGIRTQIAQEFQVPKKVVKTIVAALRERDHLPSWWQTQHYQGSTQDLDRIKAAYNSYLPIPPLGVHKEIAQVLDLPPAQVYQGIRTIRQSLGLPLFNPPEAHPDHEPMVTSHS